MMELDLVSPDLLPARRRYRAVGTACVALAGCLAALVAATAMYSREHARLASAAGAVAIRHARLVQRDAAAAAECRLAEVAEMRRRASEAMVEHNDRRMAAIEAIARKLPTDAWFERIDVGSASLGIRGAAHSVGSIFRISEEMTQDALFRALDVTVDEAGDPPSFEFLARD